MEMFLLNNLPIMIRVLDPENRRRKVVNVGLENTSI